MPVSYRKSNSKISVNENLPCFGKGDFLSTTECSIRKDKVFVKRIETVLFVKPSFLRGKKAWNPDKNSLHGFEICSKIVKYVALGFVCPFYGRVENYETGCCPSFGETPAEQFVP